jgi:hypothetical protein
MAEEDILEGKELDSDKPIDSPDSDKLSVDSIIDIETSDQVIPFLMSHVDEGSSVCGRAPNLLLDLIVKFKGHFSAGDLKQIIGLCGRGFDEQLEMFQIDDAKVYADVLRHFGNFSVQDEDNLKVAEEQRNEIQRTHNLAGEILRIN